jgi:acetylornithine deacetylase/succinyl-diaminopimelate desuccinylase-like protein
MSDSSTMIARIRAAFDARHALELLQKAISIPSVTGDEANFAGWLKGELTALGVAALSAEFVEGRPNVWGLRPGRSGADTLLLVGHTDTVHTRGWEGAVGRKRAGKPVLERGGRRLVSAVRAVRPEQGNVEAAPYWSELPILSALGIPGVYFAPWDIRICHTTEENVSLQDYYDSIIALAVFSAGADCREQVRAVERERR